MFTASWRTCHYAELEPTEMLNAKTSTAFFKRWIRKTKSFSKNLSDIIVFFQNWKDTYQNFSQKNDQGSKSTCPFFLCSTIITELLSRSLKSELKFLPVSEIGTFHTLVLNFKDWPFGVIVMRHFRTKFGYLNERVFCKLIDRTSKMLLRNRAVFYDQPVLIYGSYWVLDKKKKHKCKKLSKCFL